MLQQAFEAAEAYLFSAGVSKANERLRRYRSFVESLSKSDLVIDNEGMLNHIRIWREVHELVWVVTFLRQNTKVAPDMLLVHALDGLPVEDYTHEHGRNLFLELRAAVYFVLAGYNVELEGDCDVVATRGRTRIFVECKRIYSERNASRRMLKAYAQLEKRLAGAKGWYRNIGIVWLDPSPAMQQRFFVYSTYSREGVQAAARADLDAFWRSFIARTYTGTEKRIAGLVLQMVSPSWTAGMTKIYTCFTTMVFPGNPKLSFFGARLVIRLMHELLKFEGSEGVVT